MMARKDTDSDDGLGYAKNKRRDIYEELLEDMLEYGLPGFAPDVDELLEKFRESGGHANTSLNRGFVSGAELELTFHAGAPRVWAKLTVNMYEENGELVARIGIDAPESSRNIPNAMTFSKVYGEVVELAGWVDAYLRGYHHVTVR